MVVVVTRKVVEVDILLAVDLIKEGDIMVVEVEMGCLLKFMTVNLSNRMMLVLIPSLTNRMATVILMQRRRTVRRIQEAEVVGVGIERVLSVVERDIWQETVQIQEEAEEDSIMVEEVPTVEEEIGIEEEEVVLMMAVGVEVEISAAAVVEVGAGEVMEEGDIKLRLR